MKSKQFLAVFALLAAVAISVVMTSQANINPTGQAEFSIERVGSKVRILSNGEIRIEPRSGKGAIVPGGLVANTINFAADAGSTDAYAITLAPAITAYTTGQVIWFKANTVNTGAATLNVNALGAKTIKKAAGGITTDLATNDIRAGQYVAVVYDGANFEMLSLLGNAPDVASSILASSIADSDTTHAPDGNSVFDALALKQNALTNPVVGAESGDKIARGVAAITGSGDVATTLTTVVSVTVTPQDDLDGTNLAGCSATVGNQSGAPAAGSVTIKCWKITAADNGALIAASAAKNVNWIAVGN